MIDLPSLVFCVFLGVVSRSHGLQVKGNICWSALRWSIGATISAANGVTVIC